MYAVINILNHEIVSLDPAASLDAALEIGNTKIIARHESRGHNLLAKGVRHAMEHPGSTTYLGTYIGDMMVSEKNMDFHDNPHGFDMYDLYVVEIPTACNTD